MRAKPVIKLNHQQRKHLASTFKDTANLIFGTLVISGWVEQKLYYKGIIFGTVISCVFLGLSVHLLKQYRAERK